MSVAGGLPKPVTDEWLQEAYGAGMVPRSELKDGVYYYGNCRNARVAMWSALKNQFTYMRSKFGHTFPEDIKHPVDDDGYDLFVPVCEIEPEELELIKS